MPDRIVTTMAHTAHALRELRNATSPGVLSGVMAECWRARFGPIQRHFLLAVAAQAADPEDLKDLGAMLDRLRWQAPREKPGGCEPLPRGPNWAEPPHTQALGYRKATGEIHANSKRKPRRRGNGS
jgi:hypothetical protein